MPAYGMTRKQESLRKRQIVRTKDVDATSKFLDYVDTLDAEKFQKYPDYVFFGEWMTRHRVPYPEKYQNIWIMYDVYDLKADGYLPQKQVKVLAAEVGVPYIHVLYDGPFVDWDHCRSFMRITKYTDGDCEEGIIVKNMSKLNNPDSRAPFVLKIVNEKFSEMKAQKAPITSEQEAAKKMAFATVEWMVTRERVEKELYKMRDEGISARGVWNGRMEADCPGDRKKNLCGLREGRGGGRGSLWKTLR